MKNSLILILILFLKGSLLYAQKNDLLYLRIKGSDSLETQVIQEFFSNKTFKSYDSLKKYASQKFFLLQESGFIDAQNLSEKKINDSVIEIKYRLNQKFTQINLAYEPSKIPQKLISSLTKAYNDSIFSLPIPSLRSGLMTINNYLSSQGNPFSSVQLVDLKKIDSLITARLQIKKLKKRIITDVLVKGYSNFPKSFLKYYSNIKKNTVFKKRSIQNKSRLLDNLGFVKNIKDPEVLFTKDSTIVYLYLEKIASNTFDGFIGFSNDSESENLELNGDIKVILRNNLNYGEELNLHYKATGDEQQRFEINAKLPYLFNSPVGITGGLTIFRQDSTFLTTDQDVHLLYQTSIKSTASIGYERSTSENLLEIENLTNVADYSSDFLSLGYNYTSQRTLPLFPDKLSFKTSIYAGTRKTDNAKLNQQKGTVSLMLNPALNRRNYIYVENQSSIILSDSLLINELYRFGGLNSVRGFEENSINASLYSVFRSEYRFLLSNSFYLHSILDFAYFEDNTLSISENLSSIGFGVAFNTNTGLFKLQFANGKTSSDSFKFSNTKVHLSLLAKF